MKYPTTYTILDALLASPTEPMKPERSRHQITKIYEALRAIEIDPEPTKSDWQILCYACNMVEALIEIGACDDADGLYADAIKSLADVHKRVESGLPMRLDDVGVHNVRQLVAAYDELLAIVPERTMIAAHRQLEKRVFAILRGRGKPKDNLIG
jgi:hypothetical protein